MKKILSILLILTGFMLTLGSIGYGFVSYKLLAGQLNMECTGKKKYCYGDDHDAECMCWNATAGREWNKNKASGTKMGSSVIGYQNVPCYKLHVCQFESASNQKCTLGADGTYSCESETGSECDFSIGTVPQQCYYRSCTEDSVGE